MKLLLESYKLLCLSGQGFLVTWDINKSVAFILIMQEANQLIVLKEKELRSDKRICTTMYLFQKHYFQWILKYFSPDFAGLNKLYQNFQEWKI